MSTRWLFLDMNSFFASVEQQENPELRGKPVIVAPVMADTSCAIAASYEAKAYGIRTGTGIREAKELCPDLLIVEGNHKSYREYHYKIVASPF
jgi:DNA polymerase IV